MAFSETLLLGLLVVFAMPFLAWRLFGLSHLAPLAVIQIVGGVVLGPGVAGAIWPDAYTTIFTPQVFTALQGIASWSVIVFVFLAGVEMDLAEGWRQRRETGLTAALALILPMVLGTCVATILLGYSDRWIGPAGNKWQMVVGTGMACAVTALPILVLLMETLGILRQALGQRVLRYASVDDVAIWLVLAALLVDTTRLVQQVCFIAGFPLAAWAYRAIMERCREPDRWAGALIFVLLSSFAADAAGLHFMVGAYLAGAVSERRWFDLERLDQFRAAVLFAFMPVFFLFTGLRTRWDIGSAVVFAAALALLAASVAGKLAGVGLAGRLLKWRPGDAYVIGWLLQTKALIMIIFVSILLDRNIISADLFTALLLMAVMSTLLTIPMVKRKIALRLPE